MTYNCRTLNLILVLLYASFQHFSWKGSLNLSNRSYTTLFRIDRDAVLNPSQFKIYEFRDALFCNSSSERNFCNAFILVTWDGIQQYDQSYLVWIKLWSNRLRSKNLVSGKKLLGSSASSPTYRWGWYIWAFHWARCSSYRVFKLLEVIEPAIYTCTTISHRWIHDIGLSSADRS